MSGCVDYLEKISCMIDGELSPEDSLSVCAHLDVCQDCRRVYDAFIGITDNLAGDFVPAPESLVKNVMREIKIENGEKQKKPRFNVGRFAAIAACAAIIIFAASQNNVFTISRGGGSAPTGNTQVPDVALFLKAPEDTEQMSDIPESAGADSIHGYAEPSSATAYDDRNVGTQNRSEDLDLGAVAGLFGAVEMDIFSNDDTETPILTVTEEEGLQFIAQLLQWSDQPKDLEPDGDPAFLIGVTPPDGEMYFVRVWVVDGELWCLIDKDEGVLYLASGGISELLDLIAGA